MTFQTNWYNFDVPKWIPSTENFNLILRSSLQIDPLLLKNTCTEIFMSYHHIELKQKYACLTSWQRLDWLDWKSLSLDPLLPWGIYVFWLASVRTNWTFGWLASFNLSFEKSPIIECSSASLQMTFECFV